MTNQGAAETVTEVAKKFNLTCDRVDEPRSLDARWARRSKGPIFLTINALLILISVGTLLLLYLILYSGYPDDMKTENVHVAGWHVALAASWLTWFVLLAVTIQFHGPWIPSSYERLVYSPAIIKNNVTEKSAEAYQLIAYEQLRAAVEEARRLRENVPKFDPDKLPGEVLKAVFVAVGVELKLAGRGCFPLNDHTLSWSLDTH